MNRRAILYARVSTDEQADKGYSLPSQLEACRRYAERLGFTIVSEVIEDYSGATPIAERPRGREIVAMFKGREANVIVAYQVDRLSRDIVDLLATCREWLRAGIEIHACDIGKIESETDIVLVIRAWQGTDERKRIIERMARGRNGKAKSGKVVGVGQPLYGYSYSDGQYHINVTEASIVRKIYEWYLQEDGNGKPMACRALAIALSEMGVPTPGEARNFVRRRRNGIWGISAINRILTSETYKGVWRWGKSIGAHGNGGKRPENEHIIVNVPAIISPEMWDAAQAKRARNKRMSQRNAKNQYLLRGMINCGCKFSMHGWNDHGYLRYVCSGKLHRYSNLEEVCPEKNIRAEVLEATVWDKFVMKIFSNSAEFEQWLRHAQAAERGEQLPKQERLQTILEMITEREQEADRLARVLKNTSGGIVGQAIQRQIDEIEKGYAEQINARDRLLAELNEATLTDGDIVNLLQFRADVADGMQNPTFEDKRLTLEMLRVSATVKEGQATVRCHLPIKPRIFDLRTLQNP